MASKCPGSCNLPQAFHLGETWAPGKSPSWPLGSILAQALSVGATSSVCLPDRKAASFLDLDPLRSEQFLVYGLRSTSTLYGKAQAIRGMAKSEGLKRRSSGEGKSGQISTCNSQVVKLLWSL